MKKRKMILRPIFAMVLSFALLFNLASAVLAADWNSNKKVTASNFSILVEEIPNLTKELVILKANVKNAQDAKIDVADKHYTTLKGATTVGDHLVNLVVDGIDIPIVVSVAEKMIKQRTSITVGDVKLVIPEYDGSGWKAGAIYDATITANFKDDSSTGKKVDVTLPEGMRFVQYPVSKTPTVGTPEVAMGGVLAGFTESVTTPIKQPFYPSYNGVLSYSFAPSAIAVEIPIKIAVDETFIMGSRRFQMQ